MKRIKLYFSILAAMAALTAGACKNSSEKSTETQKAEQKVKSDQEKADSVKKYWEDKMKNAGDGTEIMNDSVINKKP